MEMAFYGGIFLVSQQEVWDGTINSSRSSLEHKQNKHSKSSPMLGGFKWFISSWKYLRLIPTLFEVVEVEDVTT
jgi:hypothetical protein